MCNRTLTTCIVIIQNHFGWDYKGASNTEELAVILEATFMIRRMKHAVLTQLPPKLRQQVFLHVAQTGALQKLHRDLSKLDPGKLSLSGPSHRAREDAGTGADAGETGVMTTYMELWKRTAQVKLPAMIAYVLELVENGHKLLLFAHHQEIMEGFDVAFYDKVRFD